MKHFTFFLVAIATMAGPAALIAPAPGHADGGPAPFVTEIPQGYRDWRWISSAHEAGKLNSLGALLGNDVAIKAFREGSFHFQMAPSSLLCITVTSRQMKTTKSLARSNLLFPGHPQTFSLWSRTQKSTPQPAAGDSVTSRTANLATRRL